MAYIVARFVCSVTHLVGNVTSHPLVKWTTGRTLVAHLVAHGWSTGGPPVGKQWFWPNKLCHLSWWSRWPSVVVITICSPTTTSGPLIISSFRLVICAMLSGNIFSPLLVGLPSKYKKLYNICTTSAQRLRRWSNLVQMS